MAKRNAKGTGTIYFREDRQKWCAQVVTGINTKNGSYIRKTVYGNTQAEVVKKKKEIENKAAQGMYRTSASYTLSSWLDQWLDMIKINIEPNTYELYELMIRVHIKPALGSIKIERLNAAQIQMLINEKFAPSDGSKGLSKRTVKYIKQTLHTSLRKAKAMQLISYNPAEDVELPKEREKSIREKAFTAEEMATFLSSSKSSPYYDLWLVAFLTGFRRGEILGLKWSDIDFDAYKITLLRQVALEKNKRIIKDQLKTAGSSGTIIVLPMVISALKNYKLKSSEILLSFGAKIDDDDFIFRDIEGNPYRPDVITRNFTKIIKQLKLRPELSLHSTRHTFATLCADINVDSKKLQAFMRHDDIKTTMHYVGTMSDKGFASEAEKINTAFLNILEKTM